LSVASAVKTTVGTVNNVSRSGFVIAAKPIVKILYPYRKFWLVRNLPNIISSLRLPISLIVVCLMVYPNYINENTQGLYVSLGVMLLVLLSDGFDGALARGLESESRYGKAVDPLADKVFYISMVACLLVGGWQIINHEIVIIMLVFMSLAIYYEIRLVMIAITTDEECRLRHSAEPVGANIWGKAKFALQSTAGFAGFGLPWLTAGFSLALCFVVLSLPLAHMSLRGHQLDLEAIKAKPKLQ